MEGMTILWGDDFLYSDMVVVMRSVFQHSREFLMADVFFCSSHLWICMTLRLVNEKPMVIADLANPNSGRPPDIRENWYVRAGKGAAELRAPSLRTLVVRDELSRSVLPAQGCTTSMDTENKRGELECFDGTWEMVDFLPFVAWPSLYIKDRWSFTPSDSQDNSALKGPFLVMREGSAGKFSKTMRGQHFFAFFKHLASKMSLDVLFLIHDQRRLEYAEMARDFRAAILFLGITHAKRTPHDIYIMDMPLFFPSKALNSLALANTGYYAEAACDDGPWRRRLSRSIVPPLCSWLRVAFQLELSSFYRMPHMFLFDSAADLARRLRDVTDEELQRASQGMHAFSMQQVKDDLVFWRNVVLGMTCNSARHGQNPSDFEEARSVSTPAHASDNDPGCLFGISSSTWQACCPIDCGSCEEEGCQALPAGEDACCPRNIARAQRPCSSSVAPCILSKASDASLGGSCDEHPQRCSNKVLQYATHLRQHIST